jgi:hypothetical protein
MTLEEDVQTLSIVVAKIIGALVEKDVLSLKEANEIINTVFKENK